MFEDLKIILTLFVMALMSAFIRFKTMTQFFTDALLGFLMGYSFYMLLSLWIDEGATRSGFCGIIILCSRPLYDWLNCFIKNKLNSIVDTFVEKEKK